MRRRSFALPAALAMIAALGAAGSALARAAPGDSGHVWSDGNGDGNPDDGVTLNVSVGDTVSVDLWVNTGAFRFTWFDLWMYGLPDQPPDTSFTDFISGTFVIAGGTKMFKDVDSLPGIHAAIGEDLPANSGKVKIATMKWKVKKSGASGVDLPLPPFDI